jgi:hypothetical protein
MGNEETKVKGEAKTQEGKLQMEAAKESKKGGDTLGQHTQHGHNDQHTHGFQHGHGRGDLEGSHLHDLKQDFEKPMGGGDYGVGVAPPTSYGRGGLGGADVGQDLTFEKANIGKGMGGYGRGDLEGLESREE